MDELGECACLHGEHPTVWFNFNAIVVFLPFMSVCGIAFNILNIYVSSWSLIFVLLDERLEETSPRFQTESDECSE